MRLKFFSQLFLLLSLILCSPAFADDLKIKTRVMQSGRIVFSHQLGEEKRLYILDFDRDSIRPITAADLSAEHPEWSPDGRRVAFDAEQSGNRDIYTAAENGTDVRRLTTEKGKDLNPSWSPDGSKLVFDSNRNDRNFEKPDIFTLNADGTGAIQLTKNEHKNSSPKWSPRGDEIIFGTIFGQGQYWTKRGLVMMPANNGPTQNMQVLSTSRNNFYRPAWSPDGSKIAFPYGVDNDVEIWVIEKGSDKPEQITQREGRSVDPVWTDDSSKIIFAGELTPEQGDYQLFIVDVKSKNETQITTGPGKARFPSWTSLPSLISTGTNTKVSAGDIEETLHTNSESSSRAEHDTSTVPTKEPTEE